MRHARGQLVTMVQQAEEKTSGRQAELIAAAQEQVATQINNELARMKALMAVNPNVRQAEIDYLQQRLDTSLAYLAQAKLRLDALRVIMVV